MNFLLASAKAAPEAASDVWTWTAIDADSKLIVSWHVGDRSQHTGISFMGDLKARLANRVELTTDGHKAYLTAPIPTTSARRLLRAEPDHAHVNASLHPIDERLLKEV